ncbi:hypothetical protein QOS_0378, partial [Clostridioides difficile Y184]
YWKKGIDKKDIIEKKEINKKGIDKKDIVEKKEINKKDEVSKRVSR